MCFGGGNNQPAPQPAPPTPGIVNVAKVSPDPSQAYKYRGEAAGPNTSGREGGGLLLDASQQAKAKTTLGGA